MRAVIIIKWFFGVELANVLLFLVGDSIIGALISATVAIFLFFVQRRLIKMDRRQEAIAKKQEELDKNVQTLTKNIDGHMTKLLDLTARASKAEGKLEEKTETDASKVPGTIETDEHGSVPGLVEPKK